jgi:hypothetical protein
MKIGERRQDSLKSVVDEHFRWTDWFKPISIGRLVLEMVNLWVL